MCIHSANEGIGSGSQIRVGIGDTSGPLTTKNAGLYPEEVLSTDPE